MLVGNYFCFLYNNLKEYGEWVSRLLLNVLPKFCKDHVEGEGFFS